MAQIRHNPARYVLDLDAHEMTTITRALAIMSGLAVKTRSEEQVFAGKLNEHILRSRLILVENEGKSIQDALAKIEENGDQSSACPKISV